MAIFKESQNSDHRSNVFYDLPNMQWHGTTLYDKDSYTPTLGYDFPIISTKSEGFGEIPEIRDGNYYFYNNHTFKFFAVGMTWENADKACRTMGGHLPYIDSEEKNAFVSTTVAANNRIWLNAVRNGNIWNWVDGPVLTTTGFSRWYSQESGEEYKYLETNYGMVGYWHNLLATDVIYYVCEWDYLLRYDFDFFPKRRNVSNIVNNFGLAPSAYMNCIAYPYNYMSKGNEVYDIPKAYFPDPDDPDIIYFIHRGVYFHTDNKLVKFNVTLGKVVWETPLNVRTNVNDNPTKYPALFKQHKIWKIRNHVIYMLGEVNRYTYSPYYYDSSTLSNSVYAINADTGELIDRNEYPDISSDIFPAIGDSDDLSISFYCGDTLIPVYDYENSSVFFSIKFDINKLRKMTNDNSYTYRRGEFGFRAGFTEYSFETKTFSPINDRIFTNYANYKSTEFTEHNGKWYKRYTGKYWEDAKTDCINKHGHLAMLKDIETRRWCYKTYGTLGWIGLYRYSGKLWRWIDETPLDKDIAHWQIDHPVSNTDYNRACAYTNGWASYYNSQYYSYYLCQWDYKPTSLMNSEDKLYSLYRYNRFVPSGYSLGLVIPKASGVDKTYNDKVCVYSCWGYLLWDNMDEDTDFCQIYRFEYLPKSKEQSCYKLNTLNSEGNPMTFADWIFDYPYASPVDYSPNMFSTIVQSYLLYEDDKKYLLVYMHSFGNSKAEEDIDTLNRMYLFKFVDENTVQLTSRLTITGTDLFWYIDNICVVLNSDKIRFVKLNADNDTIEVWHALTPENSMNNFEFACIDDNENFWYIENIYDEVSEKYAYSKRYYINPYTVKQLKILQNTADYHWTGDNINSYIDIGAISDFNKLLAKDITVEIQGNARFNNMNKQLAATTLANEYLRIPFTITGPGEIVFKANLVKA